MSGSHLPQGASGDHAALERRVAPARLRCLLVEDNPGDAAVVAAYCEEACPAVELLRVGRLEQALAALGGGAVDCVLLDLSLPDSQGLDTFLSLHLRAAAVPIVVLSGHDAAETVIDAVRMGAQDFLVKGQFTPVILARAIQFAVARQHLREQVRRQEGEASEESTQPLHPVLPRLPLEARSASGGSSSGRLAQTHNRFAIGDGLGSGGMSEVLLAHHVNLGREVAVKFLRPAMDDPYHLRLFQAEARVTAFLEHPNIVPVYDIGDNFFVMRRVHGTTLARLRELAPVPARALPHLLEALLKACDAVGYAHSQGIIHRDLKPDNIMVGDFGQVLVMDWGLALGLGAHGTPALPVPEDPRMLCAGTPQYLPPEIACAEADQVGTATDVFLLGATLFYLLSGRAPYDLRGSTRDLRAILRRAADCDHLPLAELAPEAPAALVAVAEQAMRPRPADRGALADFATGVRAWLRTRAA